MKAEVKDLWLAALRSGEYKQTTDYLHVKCDGQSSFCCLGVLSDLHAKHTGAGRWGHAHGGVESYLWDGDEYGEYGEYDSNLPAVVKEWAGMSSDGRLVDPVDGMAHLATLNDDGEYDFAKIADVIEAQWERL
jgi:hypothetical protein